MPFKRTDGELTRLFVPLAAAIGITKEMMEAGYRRLLEEVEEKPGTS